MGAGGRAERRGAWAARIYRLVWPRPGARASGAARPFAAGFFGAFGSLLAPPATCSLLRSSENEREKRNMGGGVISFPELGR